MECTDQIAAEALSNLYDVVVVSRGRARFIETGLPAIRAAIEKATQDFQSRIAYDQERYDALLLAHIQSKVDAVKSKQASEDTDPPIGEQLYQTVVAKRAAQTSEKCPGAGGDTGPNTPNRIPTRNE